MAFSNSRSRQAEDLWGHGHDHVPLGEHLPVRQRPVGSQHVRRPARPSASVAEDLGWAVLALVIEAGPLDVGHQLLGREAGVGQLCPPPGQQLVDRRCGAWCFLVSRAATWRAW